MLVHKPPLWMPFVMAQSQPTMPQLISQSKKKSMNWAQKTWILKEMILLMHLQKIIQTMQNGMLPVRIVNRKSMLPIQTLQTPLKTKLVLDLV